jgi:hypothetical protein
MIVDAVALRWIMARDHRDGSRLAPCSPAAPISRGRGADRQDSNNEDDHMDSP